MDANRLRLILTAVLVVIVVALLLWGRAIDHNARVQQTLQQMDRDVAAAKAASDAAAHSAAEAAEAARKAWNKLPGSS
jgi:hypothetical protein